VSKSSDEHMGVRYSNLKNSYNAINDYLENPNKKSSSVKKHTSNISCYAESHKRQSSKRVGWYIKKNVSGSSVGPNVKKKSFKSFDQRRALTRLEHRENSLDNPANDSYVGLNGNPLRSSSACHKKTYSNEKTASKNKSQKLHKQTSQRHKNTNSSTMKRISATKAMITLIKNAKRR
jgi:hypothetical protein